MLKKINISTKKDDVFEITDEVKKAVEESGVKEGTCVVYTPYHCSDCCNLTYGPRRL